MVGSGERQGWDRGVRKKRHEVRSRGGWMVSLAVGLWVFGVFGVAEAQEERCAKIIEGLRKEYKHQARKAYEVGGKALKGCQGSKSSAFLARLAESIGVWDQAINWWEQAVRRAETPGKREEFQSERKSVQEKFQEVAKAKLERRQKKQYWDQKLQGGRGDLVEVEEGPSLDIKVLFETNRWQIRPEGQALLDAVVETLKPLLEGGKKIRIVGHADSRGGASWNSFLSKKRAESVLDYLKSKGLQVQGLFALGEGSKRPVASNVTSEGRSKNRRVEFAVVGE